MNVVAMSWPNALVLISAIWATFALIVVLLIAWGATR